MHFWDFAGDGDREDVNLTNLQHFLYYNIREEVTRQV